MARSQPPLETALVTRAGDLVRLLPEWWALWTRAERATPFQSPAWLLPWWQVFHPGELMTVAVRRDGLLVGLAPFYLEHGRYGRRLLPLGIGITDYLDVLIDGAPAVAVGDAIGRAYAAERARWDLWSFEEISPDAVARSLSFGGLPSEEQGQSACPVLALPSTAAEWDGSRGGRRWRRAWSRVLRHDRVRIVEGDSLSGAALLEAVIDLHGRRWNANGEAGVLAHPDVRLFHRTAVPRLLASDLARLFGLEVEGRIVAAYYGLAHRGAAYGYLNGFDPDFSFESPGTALIGHAIRDAVTTGCTRFHFLRGQEAYKYAWGAADRWNVVRRLGTHHAAPKPADHATTSHEPGRG